MSRAFAQLLRAVADRIDPPKPGAVWPINATNTTSSMVGATYQFIPVKDLGGKNG